MRTDTKQSFARDHILLEKTDFLLLRLLPFSDGMNVQHAAKILDIPESEAQERVALLEMCGAYKGPCASVDPSVYGYEIQARLELDVPHELQVCFVPAVQAMPGYSELVKLKMSGTYHLTLDLPDEHCLDMISAHFGTFCTVRAHIIAESWDVYKAKTPPFSIEELQAFLRTELSLAQLG